MASKNITLTKRDQTVPVLQLVKGDRDTSDLTLNINRYDGSNDLSTLGWCVKMYNAAGDSDIQPFYPSIGEMWLVYEWTIPAVCAAEEGVTEFEVEAVDAAGGRIWQSGKRRISVIKNLEATAGYEPEEISIFQQTVSTIGIQVRDMGERMEDYEARIEDAVNTATEVSERADNAISAVEGVVETAAGAAVAAAKAADEANDALVRASAATKEATEVTASIRQQAASGAFNGKSVTHKWDGTRLVVTSASGTSYADLKGERGERGPIGLTGPAGKDWVPTTTELNRIADNAATKVQPSITELNSGKADKADVYTKAESDARYLHATDDIVLMMAAMIGGE